MLTVAKLQFLMYTYVHININIYAVHIFFIHGFMFVFLGVREMLCNLS